MSIPTRRQFLSASGAVIIAQRAASQDNRMIRHAVIGCGNQGQRHCEVFSGHSDLCTIVAVCDVDPERRQQGAQKTGNTKVKTTDDYRNILDDGTIDTVSVVTPDHWHTKIALEAVLAGKHVYVEKPCCHNIHEGQLLVKAAKKYGKCVQHGTHYRGGEGIRNAMNFLASGRMGKVRMAKAINHQLRKPIGRAPVSDAPEGVNYDRWLGPAPEHPFTQNRWHYNWHWFWNYGTGDMGNDGIHHVDLVRWGLQVGFPKAVSASGGQLFYDDDHETPDTQVVTFEYDDCYLMYEMRLWTDYKLEGHDNGAVFYCDRGKLEVGRQGCIVTRIGEEPRKIGEGSDFRANTRNFLECARANDPSGLFAPIEEGFLSAALCHLGNIATRLDRKLHIDPETQTCMNDSTANKMFQDNYRKGYELPEI